MSLGGAYFTDRSQEIGMAEVILPPNSELIGETVIGLRRGVVAHERTFLNEPLKLGDTLLLIDPWNDIERLRSDSWDLVIIKLPAELDEVLPVPGKAPQALLCLGLVVALMVSGLIPNVQAALIGCLLMGLSAALTLEVPTVRSTGKPSCSSSACCHFRSRCRGPVGSISLPMP